MSVSAFVSVTLQVEDVEELEQVIADLNLPEGASVSAQVTQTLATGMVDAAGRIVDHALLVAPPPDQVPDGTVQEVLDWVGDDPGRAQAALQKERAGDERTTLIGQLETLAGEDA